MTLKEIKEAIEQDKKVCWKSEIYEVQQDKFGYNIVCTLNGYTNGLTWKDGKTLNGEEKDFFIV